MLRKHIVNRPTPTAPHPAEEKDVAALATVSVTSEAPGYPVDHVFDGRRGPGGSRWIAADLGEQALILAFDAPQAIQSISLEIEELDVSRTQELLLTVSRDGGLTYRDVVRQEYNFAPPGTTFEREQWAVNAEGITHVQLVIKPDKGGRPYRATLTTLALR